MAFENHDAETVTIARDIPIIKQKNRRPRHPVLSRWHMTAAVQIADIVFIAGPLAVAAILVGPPDVTAGETRWIGEAFVTGLALCLVLHIAGAYRYNLLRRPVASVTTAASAWLAMSVPLFLMIGSAPPAGTQSGQSLVLWYATVACLILMNRLLFSRADRAFSNSQLLAHTICVVGGGREAGRCVRQAQSDPGNVVVLGCFSVAGSDAEPPPYVPYLGDVAALATYIRRLRVDEIVVATPLSEAAGLSNLIADLRCLPVTLSVWPDSVSLPPEWIATAGGRLGAVPLLPVGGAPLSGWSWIVKDVFDRSLAAILLFACLPALLMIAAAIRICSPGPVFFRQIREGYRGKEFRIFKFRTMHHAPATATLILATRDDRRTFPLGALLRKTSLDELPQLLNVLLGDMWLIGPRPHSTLATAADRLYVDAVKRYAGRHKIKPGITGWAQINGWRGPTSTLEQIEQRVAHDLYYIENWSLLLDLRILLMTAIKGFVHRNAF